MKIHKILIIGSGPIIVGQGSELDDAATQMCLSLKEENCQIIIVNSNPATVTTDKSIADTVYIEPLTYEFLAQIIRKELPDAIVPMVSGQTGLNLIFQLIDNGIFNELDINLLGISISSLSKIRDHALFKDFMHNINIKLPYSRTIMSFKDIDKFITEDKFPIFVHSELSVAGKGNYLAYSLKELKDFIKNGLTVSPIGQVTLEQSMKGKKEININVLRDMYNNTIIVSTSENIEPVGIHNDDSISVTPIQSLEDYIFQKIRTDAIKIANALNIVGLASIRFALDPKSNDYYLINILLGASRSSAFSEKSTGYPISWIAAKLMIGKSLNSIDIPNLKNCKANLEPSLDFISVNVPKFSTKQFENSTKVLDMQMKSTGNSIGIGRTFISAFVLAIQGILYSDDQEDNFDINNLSDDQLQDFLKIPHDNYFLYVICAINRNWNLSYISELTNIDILFLTKFSTLLNVINDLKINKKKRSIFFKAKKYNISNYFISKLWKMSEKSLNLWQKKENIKIVFKPIEPSSGLRSVNRNVNYYGTYGLADENSNFNDKSILVIGAGPSYIGQGGELDNELVHSLNALNKLGYHPVLINNNSNAVSLTNLWNAKTYIMPVNLENVLNIINVENSIGVLTQFAGHKGEVLASQLLDYNINVLGMNKDSLLKMSFKTINQTLNNLNIKHTNRILININNNNFINEVKKIGFPIFIQPFNKNLSHITSVVHNEKELIDYMKSKLNDCDSVYISKYLVGLECETEAISDGNNVIIPGIIEHIERSGILANDSMTVYPSQRISYHSKTLILKYINRLAKHLNYKGVLHVRFIIVDDDVFLIKIMLRASKSFPFLSKATNMPLAYLAIKSIFFKNNENKLIKVSSPLTAVKAPVFSYVKLSKNISTSTSAVKATGEVMGNAETIEKALYKAFSASGMPLSNHGVVLIMTADHDKTDTLSLAKRFRELGYQLWATPGTGRSLCTELPVKIIQKINQGNHKLLDEIASEHIQIIINTLSIKSKSILDSLKIREVAVEHNVPLLTSLDTADALLRVLESRSLSTKSR